MFARSLSLRLGGALQQPRGASGVLALAALARPLSYKGKRIDAALPKDDAEVAPPAEVEFLGSTKGHTIVPERNRKPKVYRAQHDQWWRREIHKQRAREGVWRYQQRHPPLPFNPRELPPAPWAVSSSASVGLGRGRRSYATAAPGGFRRPRKMAARAAPQEEEDVEEEEEEEEEDEDASPLPGRNRMARVAELPIVRGRPPAALRRAAKAAPAVDYGANAARRRRPEEEKDDEDDEDEDGGMEIKESRQSAWEEERDEAFDEALWKAAQARREGRPVVPTALPEAAKLRGRERRVLASIAPGPAAPAPPAPRAAPARRPPRPPPERAAEEEEDDEEEGPGRGRAASAERRRAPPGRGRKAAAGREEAPRKPGLTALVTRWRPAVEAAARDNDAARFAAVIKAVEAEDAVPALFVCNAAMHALAEAGAGPLLDSLLDLMLAERVFPDAVTLAVYVRAAPAAAPPLAAPGDSLALPAPAPAPGARPKPGERAARVLAADGPHAGVAGVFERFRRLAARPTAEAVTAVVQRYAAAGRPPREVLALFRALRDRYGVKMDPPAYTALIKAVCGRPASPLRATAFGGEAGKAARPAGGALLAMALLREMNREKLAADALCYTTVVSALCRRGALRAAVGAFEEALSFGCRFDTLAWNVVMFAMTVRRKTAEAEAWLARMHAEGADPDGFTYACLARALAAEGRAERARGVLATAAEEGVLPASATLEWLASAAGFAAVRAASFRQAAAARPAHGARPWLADKRRDPLEAGPAPRGGRGGRALVK